MLYEFASRLLIQENCLNIFVHGVESIHVIQD